VFGSIIGRMKGPNVRGPQCDVVVKNRSRPIGRLRWNSLGGNFAKSIDGPNNCRADYALTRLEIKSERDQRPQQRDETEG
jgi:hypothetical protein